MQICLWNHTNSRVLNQVSDFRIRTRFIVKTIRHNKLFASLVLLLILISKWDFHFLFLISQFMVRSLCYNYMGCMLFYINLLFQVKSRMVLFEV